MVRKGIPVADTYALVGWPLEHSLSPAMHNAAFADAGIAAAYVLRPTALADLPHAVDEIRRGVLAGANVTVPLKLAVRALLDEESDVVAATGAVNTVVPTAHGLRGENTDVEGFRHALRVAGVGEADSRRASVLGAGSADGGRAVVLGAGGAARSIVNVLLQAGWRVTVLNRSSGSLGVLAGTMHRTFRHPALTTMPLECPRLVDAAREARLLVNATTVGALADRDHSPWPDDEAVPEHLTVIDIVAWPPETRLLAQARAGGAAAHGGLEMLVGQAAAAWSLWTGLPAPIEVMRAAAAAAAAADRGAS